MTAGWDGQELLQPIAPDQPCGENLEDTQLLASFDAFRLFGQPIDARSRAASGAKSGTRRSRRCGGARTSGCWRTSARALLRTDGLPAFSGTLRVAAQWLDTYWTHTYPLVDEDAIVRRNALNCFADPVAVIDGLRRAVLVDSRVHGKFSLRDVDIAAGQAQPTNGEPPPQEPQINAAFAVMPLEELTGLQQSVSEALAAVKSIDTKMREEAGTEAGPELDPLSAHLVKIDRVLRAQLAMRPDGSGEPGDGRPRVARSSRGGHQVAPGCDSRARRGRQLLPAERAVEPDPADRRARQAVGLEGFSRSAGGYCPRSRRAGESRRRVEGFVAGGDSVAKASSQKFIARNRAPRVQIEYDVELYGAEKKIQLPFVMGVLADLSGKPAEPLAPVADRKFLDIDVDNFDSRMKAMKPRVAFQVPNTLTGEGNLNVELTFESMDDFSPAAVARKVDALNKLLEARQQLANLITYMDGKTGAEELVAKLLQDPALLQTLATSKKPEGDAS